MAKKDNSNDKNLKSGEKGHLTKLFNNEKEKWDIQFKETKDNFQNINSELDEIKNNIDDYRDYLLNGKDGEEALKTTINNQFEKINTLVLNSKEQFDDIKDFHSQVFEGNQTNSSIVKKFNDNLTNIEKHLENIKEKEKNLMIFYEKIFGRKNEKGEIIPGLEKELEIRNEDLNNFEKKQDKKYNTLIKQIEELLPDATSAGLAGAYRKQRDSYRNSIKIWNGMFVSSIILICLLSFFSIFDIFNRKLIIPSTLEETFILFMIRLPFILALFYLAYYSNKQQSESKRLEEEYAHKVSFASSFEGYRNQIEKLESENSKDILSQLLNKIVEMTGENPSKSLDRKNESEKSEIIKLLDEFKIVLNQFKK